MHPLQLVGVFGDHLVPLAGKYTHTHTHTHTHITNSDHHNDHHINSDQCLCRVDTMFVYPGEHSFNLSEYMVVLDKPIGLTLAQDPISGQVAHSPPCSP